MISAAPLQAAQYRLARHYLNKLRTADQALRHGQASISYGRTLFAQEWEQIKLWQAWAAQRESDDEISAQLCKDFPLAGLEVLANHTSSVDYARWLESGMEAAHRLHDDHAERDLTYELLMTSYRLGLPDEIEHYAGQLLRLGEAAKDQLSIERAWFGFGLVAEERGKFAEAESCYERALQLSLKLGIESEIGQALNGLGTVASYLGDYQKAYPYFLRQLERMEATGKKGEVCHALLSMGGVLLWLKDYSGAEDYLQRAAEMSQALGLRRLLGVSLIHLGAAALEQDHLETARHDLEEGLAAVRSVGIVRQIMSGLSLLGYTWLRMGNPQAALTHLREGLVLAREARSPRNIFNVQYNLTKTYLVLNDLQSAHSALYESLTLAQSLGGHPQKVEAVSIAAAYSQSLGQNQQAAVWVGMIMDDPELDPALMKPVFVHLEATLGSEAYQQALETGKTLSLDQVVIEVIGLLARVTEG